MNLIINRNQLVQSLQRVAVAVPGRSPNSLLYCVELVAADGKLRLSTTNLSVWASAECDQIDAMTAGRAVVDHARLIAQVRGLTDDTVSLDAEGDHLLVRSRRSKVKLLCGSGAMPASPQTGTPVASLTLAADTLGRAIGRCDWLHNDLQPSFAGLIMAGEGDRLVLCGSDSKALVLGEIQCPAGKWEAIVPADAAAAARKALVGDTGEAIVVVGDNRLDLRAEGWSLSLPLSNATPPPYRSVFPNSHEIALELDRKQLLSALSSVAEMAAGDEKSGCLPVAVDASAAGLSLHTRCAFKGDAAAEVASLGGSAQGPEIKLVVNARNVLRWLSGEPGERVTLYLLDWNRPLVFKGEQSTAAWMPLDRNQYDL